MSVSSSSSMQSVKYNGNEVPLEVALDDIYRDLQKHLNNSHYTVRTLSMLGDQSLGDDDDEFKEAVALANLIDDDTDGMIELFLELKEITKQVLGKPPTKESKEWLTAHNLTRKNNEKADKQKKKDEKLALKARKNLLNISELAIVAE